MVTKTFCDMCGKEIAKPIPYKMRYQKEVEYQSKNGMVKYKKVFISLDFDSVDCMLKYTKDNINILTEANIE